MRALPVRRRGARLHRRPRAGVRRRAEPRRAAAHPADRRRARSIRPGSSRSCITTARRSPPASSPRRSPTWSPASPSPRCARPDADDLHRQAQLHHPSLPTNKLGFTHRDYEGSISTLCAGCGHDSITAAIIQACFELDLPPHRIAKLSRHRLLVEDPDLFPRPQPRLQHRARPHAVGADRRQPRQPRPRLPRRLRRRRQRLDRARPVRACHAPRRQHGLHRREQRRVRPDQGPVLGHRRQGLEDAGAAPVNTDSPIDLVAMALQLGATLRRRAASPATSTSSCR